MSHLVPHVFLTPPRSPAVSIADSYLSRRLDKGPRNISGIVTTRDPSEGPASQSRVHDIISVYRNEREQGELGKVEGQVKRKWGEGTGGDASSSSTA